MKNNILFAVDDSPATDKAIDYLADWLNGRPATVHVVHVLPHTPAPKKKGAEKPTRAERWLAMSREDAQGTLMKAVERLKERGMDPGSVEDRFLYVHSDFTAADGLLDAAREQSCETVVLGRNALSWSRELFHHHIADELIRKAEGYTVWVVE